MVAMASKKSKAKTRCRLCLFMPVCLVILITIFAAVGSYWVKIASKYQEKQELANEIVALKEKEEELKVDVQRLEDPDYVARYAREKYMYSKEGEIILRLPDEE